MTDSSALERLTAHRTIGGVPREQLEWLVANGREFTLQPGEVLTPKTGPVKGLYIVLDGHLLIRVDGGAGPRIVMEWRGGDVTGVLPYSRIKAPPGDVVADEASRIFAVDTALLPRLIRDCPDLTAVLVHVMLDRARVFKTSELIDEKMASLGRLAAGLAHELNNPASAVARSAKTLCDELSAHHEASTRLSALKIPDGSLSAIEAWLKNVAAAAPSMSPLAIADRQDAIEAWLSARAISGHGFDTLGELGFQASDLDKVAGLVGPDQIGPVLSFLSSGHTVKRLVGEIDTAASRIHSLVAAVKGFTYVNQQATPLPIAIGRGLADTVTVLRSKARMKSVDVGVRVPDDLPCVDGYGGELNQVWANLLDNAIDASPGGHVRLEASAADNKVVVRIVDDGPGIPAALASRIFDPFFTTKDVGQGVGLGLDIARRIVQRHHGVIDIATGPGGTEFKVTLPASGSRS